MANDTGTIYGISKLLDFLAKWSPGFGLVTAFFVWITDFVNRVLYTSLHALNDKLASIDLTAFRMPAASTIDMIGIVNAVVPVTEMFAMLTAYFVAWGVVLGVRWVKSFIPTMAN